MAIRIDPNTMRQRASQYRNEAQNVESVISSMNSLLGALQSEWEGEASRAYAQKYESELKPNFIKAKEMIEEIATTLDKIAADTEEQDRIIAAGIGR